MKRLAIIPKLLLWHASLCIPSIAFCQPAFNKIFGIANKASDGLSVVVENDSTYLVGGFAGTNFPYELFLLLARVDKAGDTIWTKKIGSPLETWAAGTVIRESDSIYVTCDTWQTGTPYWEAQQKFVKFDWFGDTLWTLKVGNDTLLDNASKMIRDSNDDYVCSGWSFENDDEEKQRILLTKVSADGELIFEKRYPEVIVGYHHYIGGSVAQVDDGGYVVVGGKYPDASPFTPGYDIYYTKVDSDGNQLWTKQIPNVDWDGATDVLSNGNNGFVMCGYTSYPLGAASFLQKLWIGSFNQDGNLLDENDYTDGWELYVYPSRMIRTEDGGYVIVGEMDSAYNHTKAFVAKFDSTLNLKWFRGYKRAYADYLQTDLFWDVKETLNLGLIASGRTREGDTAQSHQNVWLVKMDSLGCDVPGCDTLDTDVQPLLAIGEVAIVAFPNPANDKIYFKYRLPANIFKAEIIVTDGGGKQIALVEVNGNAGVSSCDARSFTSGLCFITLRTQDGNIASCKLIIAK